MISVTITMTDGVRTLSLEQSYSSWASAVKTVMTVDAVPMISVESGDNVYVRTLLGVPAELVAERDGEKGEWRN